MLGRRRRRRANIEPTLGKRLVFAGWSAVREVTLWLRYTPAGHVPASSYMPNSTWNVITTAEILHATSSHFVKSILKK